MTFSDFARAAANAALYPVIVAVAAVALPLYWLGLGAATVLDFLGAVERGCRR